MDVSIRYDLIASSIRTYQLTRYQQYIWSIAQSPQTFPDHDTLRLGLQALITLYANNAPACLDAVAAIQDELDTLDDAAAIQKIGILVDEVQNEAETFFRTLSLEEQNTIARFELEHRLAAFQSQQFEEQEVEMALEDFGAMNMQEARPDVERFLTHPSPGLRQRALTTLLLFWHLPEYTEVAFQFLQDADPDCRWQGMRCLNPSREILDDLRVLQAYARIVANQDECSFLRLDAYNELRIAIGYELDDETWQQMDGALEKEEAFDQLPLINWELVRFFIEEKGEQWTFLRDL